MWVKEVNSWVKWLNVFVNLGCCTLKSCLRFWAGVVSVPSVFLCTVYEYSCQAMVTLARSLLFACYNEVSSFFPPPLHCCLILMLILCLSSSSPSTSDVVPLTLSLQFYFIVWFIHFSIHLYHFQCVSFNITAGTLSLQIYFSTIFRLLLGSVLWSY